MIVSRPTTNLAFLLFIGIFLSCSPTPQEIAWPAISRETKPWTRWWWQGNALTKEGITSELEAFQKAGFGGVEITPIYGVYGYEKQFINFLSPEWMELLGYTLKEAERLDLGVDMATGTGWPFGGPWIGEADACKDVRYKIYNVKGGQRLIERVQFIEAPYLRVVGNQIYEVHDNAKAEGRVVQGTRQEPVMNFDRNTIRIEDLVQPVAANPNLQALAIDQVQFEKTLPLQVIMAYDEMGTAIDLTANVDSSGKLDWVAPGGDWKLVAVFQGWHGKMVERAGPGGEGNVIDHFSGEALNHYLARFDSAFANSDIGSIRSFFNDSYEVDDARGAADWTPTLLDEFKKRRGYDLRDHLLILFSRDTSDIGRRVLCDYRETISELLLDNFTRPWTAWAHGKSAVVRNQAHGSPSNILDLYATVDIPEIEGVEPLRIKMASSAGNVTGKKLISSESATWLDEHFESGLGDIKMAVDRFLLNGVNHIFYHGTNYSPPDEPWPGWLFYAAVHLNPRNPEWGNVHALNEYVARCQTILQNSSADHDVLLYYPIYDRFSEPGDELIEHFDGIGKQFDSTVFESVAEQLMEKGFTFDFISDKQIGRVTVAERLLVTEGKSNYKTLIVPHVRFMPLATLQKIVSFAEQGAIILMVDGPPDNHSGFADLDTNKKLFEQTLENVRSRVDEGIRMGPDVEALLEGAGIEGETLSELGLDFDRKKNTSGNVVYFIRNRNAKEFDGWIDLRSSFESVFINNPMTGETGSAAVRGGVGRNQVFVQIAAGATLFLRLNTYVDGAGEFPYSVSRGEPVHLMRPWQLSFTNGGPTLPGSLVLDSLTSWTRLGPGYHFFSGTASYSIQFDKPTTTATSWMLDLGVVEESAEVLLNDQLLATLIGPNYQVTIASDLLKEKNKLEVRVSNLMANRVIWMERENKFWKKFYNVNFPARKAENRVNGLFDASRWEPRPSGLLGPVRLIPTTTAIPD